MNFDWCQYVIIWQQSICSIIINSFWFSSCFRDQHPRPETISSPQRHLTIDWKLLQNWVEAHKKFMFTGAGRRSEKQEAKYSRVARWCAPSNCLARPMPSSKVTWESNPFTGPNCETSRPRRRLGGVRLAPLPHNQPGVVCGGGGDGGVRRFWGLMENWQGDETYLASCAISISVNSGIRFIPLVHHFNYRILGDLAFNPESCKSICLASISVRFLNLPPITSYC